MVSRYHLDNRPRRRLYAGLLTITVLPFLVLPLVSQVAKGVEPVAQQGCEAILSQDKTVFMALFAPQHRGDAEGFWSVLEGLQSELTKVKSCELEGSGIRVARNGTGATLTVRLRA